MSRYTYTVERVGRDVIYCLYRGDDLIDQQNVEPVQLGFLNIFIFGVFWSLETIIEKCMLKAHKSAKQAISNLKELEKLETKVDK